MGHLRVTVGHLRVTIGHPRVTVGHPRVPISHLRATMGHLRLTSIGYLKAVSTILHHSHPYFIYEVIEVYLSRI